MTSNSVASSAGAAASATGAAATVATGAAAETPHLSSNALTNSEASKTLKELSASTSFSISAILKLLILLFIFLFISIRSGGSRFLFGNVCLNHCGE